MGIFDKQEKETDRYTEKTQRGRDIKGETCRYKEAELKTIRENKNRQIHSRGTETCARI